MSAHNSSLERRPSKRKSFIKKIVPKFLRRSHSLKHSSDRQTHPRSFVVDDDDSEDNWSVDNEPKDGPTPEHGVIRVHVSPTKYIARSSDHSDSISRNSDKFNERHEDIEQEGPRLRFQFNPEPTAETAPSASHITPSAPSHIVVTSSVSQNTSSALSEDVHITPSAPLKESLDASVPTLPDGTPIAGPSAPDGTRTAGQGQIESRGCIGTIQVKLAPNDYDIGENYEALLKTLEPRPSDTGATSNGSYDFPIEQQPVINNSESSTYVSGAPKTLYVASVVNGWGMVVLCEGSEGIQAESSRLEDMLLSSSMDDALTYRHTADENGWGMVYTPDNLSLSWSFNPIKDTFGAFWDILSVLLVSLIFLITGTAVSMVTVWQAVFSVIDVISSISKFEAKVSKMQNQRRIRPFRAPIKLPTSATFQIENPFKKLIGLIVKPIGAVLFVTLAPIFIVEGLISKAKNKLTGRRISSSVPTARFNTPNLFSRMFRRPNIPKMHLPSSSGRSALSTGIRFGSNHRSGHFRLTPKGKCPCPCTIL